MSLKKEKGHIKKIKIMEQVKIYCRNTGEYKNYPMGTTLEKILEDQEVDNKKEVVCALVNNKCESLSYSVFHPKDVEFMDVHTKTGRRTYIRTLCMVMAKATHDLYPTAQLFFEHPLSKGYFCNLIFQDGTPVSDDIISKIQMRMHELIEQKLPIKSHEMQKEAVLRLFKERREEEKVNLLKSMNITYAQFYEIDGYYDFYNTTLMVNTGELSNNFNLFKYDIGIFLQVPKKENLTILEPFENQPKMYQAFKQNLQLQQILGINNIGDLNELTRRGEVYGLIKIAEALHEKQIVRIADSICKEMDTTKFIMISGPSSSGKTTFSKRLTVQLLAAGVKPITISLDDYFIDRERTPKDENGEYDYESLYALDLDFFNEQLQALLSGKEVSLPTYDFASGKRLFKGNNVQLKENNIVMMEGIHALNPALTPSVAETAKFKIYVSALTTISLDDHNWISTTDNRLIRRIVRDYKYRGNTVQNTIARWESVRDGEKKWIFPYQENADVMFNSALIFELAALKNYVLPMLQTVPRNSKEYAEVHHLMKFLHCITPISNRDIPSTSLLREFLGGSSFKY